VIYLSDDKQHKGALLKAYRKRMTEVILRVHPEYDKDDVKKVINRLIDKNLQNPEVTLDNNYTGESRETTLLSVLDWSMDTTPIVAGNMTFYKNQHEAINPVGKMLDNKLELRKSIKKEMFKAIAMGETEMADDLDRSQGNTKRLVNSYYGGSGAPTSAFYSEYSGPKMLRVLISLIAG
jgi:DNA polymerase elongation subunit (family B)